jgi:hypothetical protein
VTGLEQQVLVAPEDGSLGPLLRLAVDRLAPGQGYGRHAHRAVDVVAVVLAGELRHRWNDDVPMRSGDVAVLRAGTGLEHDEVAGDDGARVLQAYMRSAEPALAPAHEVLRSPGGAVDLARPDASLWLHQAVAAETVTVPPGLLVVAETARTAIEQQTGGPFTVEEAATLVVWQLAAGRPAWALEPEPPA